MIVRTKFEDALAENLSLYCGQSDIPLTELFSTHREIAIARLALSKQAEAYFMAIETLNTLLSNAIANPNDKLVQTILVAVGAIEEKSARLIKSVQETISLLGSIVEIDVDKARLRAMLVSLPSLVREVINSTSGDEGMAERVSLSLNNRISDMMVAIRFSEDSLPAAKNNEAAGVTLEQYEALLNSVPTCPVS